jgi:hypothetical protein
MDILGAFNNVSYTWLLDNLRKRKIPNIIIIKVFKGESKIFNTETEIP